MTQEENIIHTRGLTKTYRIYPGPRTLLREVLSRKSLHEQVLALQDISFSIARGETFGVIGDNGSGKSTLLKILAGTCYATTGEVTVQGQVSALLELGTGFHPEFTGIENIYFSGALMGLEREEVAAREAAIIEFSELGPFIEHPVRTYSTGMHLRLGFSVATGFDSEILIIDEALSVGDQRFQKKCIDRIHEFRDAGRTILFCSHNLIQVKAFCQRTLWLHDGVNRGLGTSAEVVERYNDFSRQQGKANSSVEPPRERKLCWIESARLLGREGEEEPFKVRTGDSLELEIVAHFDPDFPGEPGVGMSVVRNDGLKVFGTATPIDGFQVPHLGDGRYACRLRFPRLGLLSGRFSFSVFTTDHHQIDVYDAIEGVEPFEVTHSKSDSGLTRMEHEWGEMQATSNAD